MNSPRSAAPAAFPPAMSIEDACEQLAALLLPVRLITSGGPGIQAWRTPEGGVRVVAMVGSRKVADVTRSP